ncbi:hypothetical protein BDZ89DRAFT_1134623 [Hymenopellis radicata]|nr:hypothetical protein BDZ89DRAFT_1134623 [Hymenopellis radicata]
MSHPDATNDTLGMKTIMSFLSLLHVQSSADLPFLPKLCHLSIGLSKHLDRIYFPYLERHDDLVKALQSRWNAGRFAGVERLQTFRFGIYAQLLDDKEAAPDASPLELSPEIEQALQVLVNDGMKISIHVYSKFARYDADHLRVNF